MNTEIRIETDNPDLVAGIVEADGVTIGASPEKLVRGIDLLLAKRCEPGFPPDDQRKAVRDLFRRGGFKPTGRNKPASEYLARAAEGGTFPRINNVVDSCNFYSLLTGLPISLLDLDLAMAGTDALVIREGAEGERYVFNHAGQEIDVTGLLSIARAGGLALGNAVKDSMETKTHVGTRNVVAVIWGTLRVAPAEVLERMAAGLGDLLREHAGAEAVEARALPEPARSWTEGLEQS